MTQFVSTHKMGGFIHLAEMDGSVWRHFGITEQPAFAFVAVDGAAQAVPGVLSEQTSADGLNRRQARSVVVQSRLRSDVLRRGRRLAGGMRRVNHVGVHELQPGVGVLG
jgi:hypothetical protein